MHILGATETKRVSFCRQLRQSEQQKKPTGWLAFFVDWESSEDEPRGGGTVMSSLIASRLRHNLVMASALPTNCIKMCHLEWIHKC